MYTSKMFQVQFQICFRFLNVTNWLLKSQINFIDTIFFNFGWYFDVEIVYDIKHFAKNKN